MRYEEMRNDHSIDLEGSVDEIIKVLNYLDSKEVDKEVDEEDLIGYIAAQLVYKDMMTDKMIIKEILDLGSQYLKSR